MPEKCSCHNKIEIRPARFGKLLNVLVTTHFLENYGAHDHDWDNGDTIHDVPQYWKFKGGHDILVCGVDSFQNATALANYFIHEHMFGEPHQGVMEFIAVWELVGDDFIKGYPNTYEEFESGRYVDHILDNKGQELEEVPKK
mgnify:CR=1 FL=1